MKIDNHYEEHLASQGISLDLNEPLRKLWVVAENVYAMAYNANCYSHIRTLLLQKWQKHEEVLRVSGAFIHFTANSLAISMMMEVSKIYDSNKKSKTIYLLNEKAEFFHDSLPTCYSRSFDEIYQDIVNPEERAGIIHQLKNEYETTARNNLTTLSNQLLLLKPIVMKIKLHRNKIYAHNDFLDEKHEVNLISEYPVTLLEINKLIDFALDYSTTIIALITGLIRPITPVNINDFEGLMQYILEGHEAIQAKLKALDSELEKTGVKGLTPPG